MVLTFVSEAPLWGGHQSLQVYPDPKWPSRLTGTPGYRIRIWDPQMPRRSLWVHCPCRKMSLAVVSANCVCAFPVLRVHQSTPIIEPSPTPYSLKLSSTPCYWYEVSRSSSYVARRARLRTWTPIPDNRIDQVQCYQDAVRILEHCWPIWTRNSCAAIPRSRDIILLLICNNRHMLK